MKCPQSLKKVVKHIDCYGDYGVFSANTNVALVNRNDIENEGNDVEMNR